MSCCRAPSTCGASARAATTRAGREGSKLCLRGVALLNGGRSSPCRGSETLTAVNNLASLHKARGDVTSAAALYAEALDARRAQLGPAHPDTLTSINNVSA